MGAASNAYLTLNTVGNDAKISLRYYQLNFWSGRWRVRPNLSVSIGLRYEYNTPVRELNRRIENTFNDPALSLVPGLGLSSENAQAFTTRTGTIFAPRLGIAYSPDLFGGTMSLSFVVGSESFTIKSLGLLPASRATSIPLSDSELRRAKCLRE
jgi:outer membrane receptor protein involved in Fe transport